MPNRQAGLLVGLLVSGFSISLLISAFACSYTLGQQNQKNEAVRDEDIAVVRFEEMKYPLSARLKHTQGVVVVRVKLDDAGKVLSSEAMSGPKDLIPDCLSNVKKWQFRPNSRKVAVILYEFRIEGSCYTGMSGHFVFREPNIVSVRGCELVVQP